MLDVLALILLALLSFVLVAIVRSWAIRQHMLDIPNRRSCHSLPTPRGGGLAIVLSFLVALSYLAVSGQIEGNNFIAFMGGGILVAAIGYWDDRHDLSARFRLWGHFTAAVWAVIWTGGIAHLDLGFVTWEWGWLGYIVSVLGIVWLLNLYNFMDGIDGIAASEAVYVLGVGGLFLMNRGSDGLAWVSLALAAACTGFLFWNWPPAKIFMGDVCSGFLGYMMALLAIVSDQKSGVSLWVWLLLLSVFIVDATVTLVRRLLNGRQVFQAHRSHAYQHAAIQFDSHLKVTVGILGINLFGLLPLALVTWNWPSTALITTSTAIILLTIAALRFRAGIETIPGDGKAAFGIQEYTEIDAIN